jgi:hypothetical protein
MAKVLFQFRHRGARPPGLQTLYRRYGFRPGEVDRDYGIVEVDPVNHWYTALVDEGAQERVDPNIPAEDREGGAGFFSNPRIEPFGDPRP